MAALGWLMNLGMLGASASGTSYSSGGGRGSRAMSWDMPRKGMVIPRKGITQKIRKPIDQERRQEDLDEIKRLRDRAERLQKLQQIIERTKRTQLKLLTVGPKERRVLQEKIEEDEELIILLMLSL